LDEETKVEGNSYEVEANSLMGHNLMFNTYTPHGSNISLEEMKDYIRYPMIYNEIIRKVSRMFYHTNGLYANVIDYCTSIPNLDHITVSRNKKKTSKIKKDKEKFNLILKMINHKRTSRDILRHLFIDGMYVGILRDTIASNKDLNLDTISVLDRIEGLSLDDNFMIQPLDLDYCKIIGYQNNISIAAFDMMYFDQFKHGGLIHEIKNFPVEFIKAYSEYKKDGSKRWFKLDYRKTIALKARSDESQAYGLPYGLAAFAKMKIDDDYEASQHKLIEELASSIYYMILPEGEKKGSCSLSKTQQDNVIEAFKGAVKVNSTGGGKISTLSLAPGTTIDRLAKDASLLKDTLSDENIKKISTGLGFASSALNAESQGGASYSNLQVNVHLILSQLFQYVEEIAIEQTRVLNHHIGNQPKDYIDVKYLKTSALNQDTMYDRAKELYATGSGSLKMWIATAGFDPDDYLSLMEEELDEGIFERFKPHLTSYTSNNETLEGKGKSGAPAKAEEDLKPSGQVTRNVKSNEKKVKK
jgi:hypothetical protein